MAKSKISEIKKITHKLAVEGTLTVNTDNTISIDAGDEGIKTLHELSKNFSGSSVKITITEEETEDVEPEE